MDSPLLPVLLERPSAWTADAASAFEPSSLNTDSVDSEAPVGEWPQSHLA